MKTADTLEQSWDIQDKKEGQPHGWIQWKGTDVCMDLKCSCGEHTHIDGMFAYAVKCGKCGKIYGCNGHIELIEIKQEPDNFLVSE